MKSSIYISSDKIEIIGYTKKAAGKVSVNKFLTYPLPEGTMINGTIVDYSALKEALTEFKKQDPSLFVSPALVVDGNFIFTKRIPIPKSAKRVYEKYIPEEFSDADDNTDNLICEFHNAENSDVDQMVLQAYTTKKSHIEEYISVFRESGININSIRIGIQSIFNYVKTRPDLLTKTFVLNIIDEVTVLSMVFENGVNIFASRSRLFSENREQFIKNLLSNLSGLIQFNKSEKFTPIEACYYLGVDDNITALLTEMNPHPDVSISVLDIFDGDTALRTLCEGKYFAYLSTFLAKNSIDFLAGYKRLTKTSKKFTPLFKLGAAFAGFVVLLMIPIFIILFNTSVLNNKIDDINNYLNDPAVIEKSDEIDDITANTSIYAAVVNQLKAKTGADESKMALSGKIPDLITATSASKVSVLQFGYDDTESVARVNAVSDTESDSAKYVNNLRKHPLVKGIIYTGYNYNSEGKYDFSIEIRFAAEEK